MPTNAPETGMVPACAREVPLEAIEGIAALSRGITMLVKNSNR
jgi:hypothetical protein